MGRFGDPEKYKNKFPLNPKDIISLRDAETGKVITAEVGSVMDQMFDLGLLGQSCLSYPTTVVTDCDGNDVTLPLQIAQVLLLHEQKICEAIGDISYIQNNCCDGSDAEDIERAIYNEFLGEPNEWTVTESTGGLNITLNSTNNPFLNNVCIEINESDASVDSEVILTNDSLVPVLNIKEIRYNLDLENFKEDLSHKIVFRKGAVEVHDSINITEGLYGFSNNNIGYNEIIVPLNEADFSDIDFDNIIMRFEESTDGDIIKVDNVFVDNIRLYHSPSIEYANVAPTVSASSDQTIQLPINSVTLNSYGEDVDGIIVSYLWEKIMGGNAVIQNENFSTTVISGLEEGTYLFKVTVTDNEGATGADYVYVTVKPLVANLLPIADAGADQLIYLPTNSVSLNGSGFDSDGYITTYLWEKISGGSATINNPNASTTTVDGLVEDTYVFRLTVTDNNGATGTDEITVEVGDGANLVAVNVEIDLGDCDTPADWVGAESVWVDDLASVASGGDFNQQNGDTIYTENSLTTPFNGGDNLYSFRGVSPIQLTNNRVFKVSAVGVISEMHECSANDNVHNFDYDSGSSLQPDTYTDLTYAILASGYATNSGSPASKFKIKSLPSTGDLGLQGTAVVVNQEIPLSEINSNYFAFWADGLNGNLGAGDYQDSFTYIIIDANGVESNEVTLTLNANDTYVTKDVTYYSALSEDNCHSERCIKVNVPVGETREVTISKSGTALYSGQQAGCIGAEVVLADKVETISATKIYSVGLDASTGSGNSSTTITVSVTGGNSLQIQRTHQSPVINC